MASLGVIFIYYQAGEMFFEPFRSLDPRVKILGYKFYVAYGALFAALLCVIAVNVLCLFSVAGSTSLDINKVIIVPMLILGCISAVPRYWYQQKVEENRYVECKKERMNRFLASWNIYADSPLLCKKK